MVELRKVTQVKFRQFFSSEWGQEGLLHLREITPSVSKGSADEIIFDAGRSQGWKDCIDALTEILGTEVKKTEDLENH